MKISDVLSKNLIIPNLVSRTKRGVLNELVSSLVQYGEKISKEELLRALVEREKFASTGIDNGVAIPHSKFKNIDTILMVLGRSRDGIDFGALDGNLSYFFFLIVAPENSVGHHLSILSCISLLAKSRSFRKHCMEATSNAEIYQLIKDEEGEILKQTV
jgi:PTS system nitrogen regulatory IIA component